MLKNNCILIETLENYSNNNNINIVFFLAILQRTSVDVGRIRIQGVATCLYLCMDACGSVYGSVSYFLIFLNTF